MKYKKSILFSSIIAATSSYYLISNKIFNDILVAKTSSKASDGTNYTELNKHLVTSGNWLKKQPYSTETIYSNDNLKLQGYQLLNKGSNNWVILAHGYKSSIKSMLYAAKKFYDEGYNILLIDQRSHGDSEGKYIGMGWLEKDDLSLWINHIINQDQNSNIVLYGVSMGATTVMMTTGIDLPINVKCAIEDCGYSSLEAVFKDQAIKKYNIHDTRVFIGLYKLIKIKLGFDVKEASAINQLKKSKIPTLFIHGDNDLFVPCSMVYDNYNACISEKELYIAPNQGHALACLDEKYFKTVFTFIKKNI